MISYAQCKEDVYLWRALAHRVHNADAFYIDVGAYDPLLDSVTKALYDCGWRGINVEPVAPFFANFVAQRPDEINLQQAVSDHIGEAVFHEIVGHQLSTLERRFAERHESTYGWERREYAVPVTTLTQICELHARPEIHFLKIDVEGHEGAVIRGMDFTRFRPWILVIEATEPNNLDAPTFGEWDADVLAGGYRFAFTDRLNRYYVANEHVELLDAFVAPVDDYVLARDLRIREALERELEEARERIRQLETL